MICFILTTIQFTSGCNKKPKRFGILEKKGVGVIEICGGKNRILRDGDGGFGGRGVIQTQNI
jgi:hypothetical protein